MSTRSVITFKDENDTFSVYKHCDGYPEGVLPCIEEAKLYAWELPRFEAADFAAAFIRATKDEGGGNIYFTKGPEYHGDLEYRYTVDFWAGELHIDIWTNHLSEEDYKLLEKARVYLNKKPKKRA